ncbi:unnamed protein product [Microthlaspi erraticum]|uniref:Uncharacterized protein n=1 Tax=Microthlaspi erraticum TaxID=1685480 RepID=A0A6D2HPE7_9BRAS|nr:unnamed protein product [Microthlaspi erraticum]
MNYDWLDPGMGFPSRQGPRSNDFCPQPVTEFLPKTSATQAPHAKHNSEITQHTDVLAQRSDALKRSTRGLITHKRREHAPRTTPAIRARKNRYRYTHRT